MEFLIFISLIVVGYLAGGRAERKHFAAILEREQQYVNMPVRCDRQYDSDVRAGFLVYGAVVVSADYFKVVVAGLRNFFGGNITVYDSLLDRARREATLRMKEMALRHNAEEIINFRLETSMLNDKGANTTVSVEIFAYGTALRR